MVKKIRLSPPAPTPNLMPTRSSRFHRTRKPAGDPLKCLVEDPGVKSLRTHERFIRALWERLIFVPICLRVRTLLGAIVRSMLARMLSVARTRVVWEYFRARKKWDCIVFECIVSFTILVPLVDGWLVVGRRGSESGVTISAMILAMT
jgi:hypothetical protein